MYPTDACVVDNGHLVAWTAKYKIERINAGGFVSALHTDEGLVCRYDPTCAYRHTVMELRYEC